MAQISFRVRKAPDEFSTLQIFQTGWETTQEKVAEKTSKAEKSMQDQQSGAYTWTLAKLEYLIDIIYLNRSAVSDNEMTNVSWKDYFGSLKLDILHMFLTY